MMRKLGMSVVALCLAGASAGVARAQVDPKSVVAAPAAGKVEVPDRVLRGVREAVPGFRMHDGGASRQFLAYGLEGRDTEGREVHVQVCGDGFVQLIDTMVPKDDLKGTVADTIAEQFPGIKITRVSRRDTRYRVLGLRFHFEGHMVEARQDDKPFYFAIEGPTTRIP